MDPANPPLPTPMNLPFHASAGGSHNSMLISESDEGVSTSCTRQCAGIRAAAGGGAGAGAGALAAPRAPPVAAGPRPPPRAGAGPSGTICALEIVALSSLRLTRLSHGVVAAAALRNIRAMLAIISILLRRPDGGAGQPRCPRYFRFA